MNLSTDMIKRIAGAAAIAALALPATASAATTANGSQAVTGTPTAQLEATFPAAYGFGALAVGGTGNVSTEQTINVKSNKSWGLKVSTPGMATGRMRQYDTGTNAYAASPLTLTHAIEWALTSNAGTAVGSPAYAAASGTATSVVTTQGRTSDSGQNVGVKFRQLISYADEAGLPAGNTYRVDVTYAAEQGF